MRWIITLCVSLVAGFAGAAAWDYAGLGPDRTREALLANPEILPEAMQELQRRDMVARIEPLRSELETPFPGAVIGNPDGEITLVEFTDYACGYCRQSLDHVKQIVAAHPDVKVVIREYPILSAGSADAARMALAAAQQGRFEQFHDAMFAAEGLSAGNIEQAAREAGVDLERAQAAIEAGSFESQLQNNVFLAQNMGVNGTPAWVVGDQVLSGAVGPEVLGAAIDEARDS
ncbi:DsbA family protein [Aurantiacibacter rhizosphaerae]|uniref:Thioredoxin domain-containing protein n=1 Tax=Aurantiacibacter rhizosphaerae TaxID=2691582 RepID=A0A844X8Y1_9SPHN|nr:DsbA family protein [Aurantiacibacter rhizosphaerae]MWV26426.1 thioredoxin domain-containing protein [Aurantiacibacter rhizosphaerae]